METVARALAMMAVRVWGFLVTEAWAGEQVECQGFVLEAVGNQHGSQKKLSLGEPKSDLMLFGKLDHQRTLNF